MAKKEYSSKSNLEGTKGKKYNKSFAKIQLVQDGKRQKLLRKSYLGKKE